MENLLNSEFVPKRQTTGSAGYDIYAVGDMDIQPWFKSFDTGVCFDGEECPLINVQIENGSIFHQLYPKSWVGLILPRSSFGFKHGLRFANTMCVIDQDYRDTIRLSIAADHPFTIRKGERYAQLIFIPNLVLLNEEEPVKERSGGIGSTDQAY